MAPVGKRQAPLLKRLIAEGFVRRVTAPDADPQLLELFRGLADTYVLLDIEGSDGGKWLYQVEMAGGRVRIEERDLQETETEAYRAKHFILALPDWVIYDVLLGDMTVQEAMDHAAWGGSLMAHPAWTYLKIGELLEAFEDLLDRQAILRLVRG
ncbi:MAG: hypothetical protein ACE5IG_07970 [Dehalococcoidia bacterium]